MQINRLAGFGALSFVLTLAACQKPATGPTGEDLPEAVAEKTMYGMETFSNSEGRRIRTHADTAYVFGRDSLELRGLNMQMFDESGRKTGTVTSKAGSLNSTTRSMVARGNVVLLTPDGKRIHTEQLHYDPNSKRIWSNVPTLVINPDGTRQNMKTFETDDKFRNLRATGATGATGIRF